MAYVADASVALKWLIFEEDAEHAVRFLTEASRIVAPRLIFTEVANALWKKCRNGLMPEAEARRGLDVLPRYFSQLLDVVDLQAAFDLAVRLDHPVYDCIYLEAARQQDIPLVTSDSRLITKGRQSGVRVVHLSQWDAL